MHRQITLATLFTAVAVAGLSVGCLQMDATDEDLAGTIGEHEQEAYVLTANLWTSRPVQVCWEDTGSFATERQWVQWAIEGTWEWYSALDLTGWGACAANSGGIRIQIADDSPNTSALGPEEGGVVNHMRLNFTFQNWNTACGAHGEEVRRKCIQYHAVREFGHAIGFAREDKRPDTMQSCVDASVETGDQTVGTWDPDSVMNYCSVQPRRTIRKKCRDNYPDFWNETCWHVGPAAGLSDNDIFAVQYYYGTQRSPYYVLLQIAAQDKCADVASGGTANGTPIVQQDCSTAFPGTVHSQLFWLEPYDNHYRIKHGSSEKCLDIGAANTSDGDPVYLSDCSGTHSQQFSFRENWSTVDARDFQFMARHSGKCLNLDSGPTVHQWTCSNHGNPEQMFRALPPRSPGIPGVSHSSPNSMINRKDIGAIITLGNGYWGDWGEMEYCPPDTYAYDIALRSQPTFELGFPVDDTALNSVSLHCKAWNTGVLAGWIYSAQGPDGSWGSTESCPASSGPLTAGQIRLHAPQGNDPLLGDDTGANSVRAMCSDGTWKAPSAHTDWGGWHAVASCPAGQAVCGLQTRVEGPQGVAGDDTALNGVRFQCCDFPLVKADDSFYSRGQPIRANFDCSGQSTSTTDWVGIFPRGVTPGQQPSTTWVYTSGTDSPTSNLCLGDVDFNLSIPGFSNITPGEWTLWYLKNDGYVPFGKYDFRVM